MGFALGLGFPVIPLLLKSLLSLCLVLVLALSVGPNFMLQVRTNVLPDNVYLDCLAASSYAT